jgi:redox-regulated HSP33 family molecular chaperone
MSYTSMVAENEENKAIADAAREASQNKKVTEAHEYGKLAGVDAVVRELQQAQRYQAQRQDSTGYLTDGLAGILADSTQTGLA